MSDRSIMRLAGMLLLAPTIIFAYSDGPPDGYAGLPRVNRRSCVQCHNSFQVNSGQGSLRLTGLPEAYVPGETYRIGIQLADPDARRWGFELAAADQGGSRVGSISVVNNDQTQLSDPGENSPQYLKHRSAGTFRGQANSAEWSFDWTAPDWGNAVMMAFYVAANAANNNGGNDGDRIYRSSFDLLPIENNLPIIREPSEEREIALEVEAGTELIIEFSGTDQDQDELDWFIENRSGLPEAATLTDHGDGTATFAWTPTQNDIGENTPVFGLGDIHDGFAYIDIHITTIDGGGQAGFTLHLNASWNLISAPISPAETNTPMLWQELVDRGHLMMIKDQSGRFYAIAQRFSNLSAWDYRQGYFVRMSVADTIRIIGDEVAIDTPIPLRDGWNFVAYFPEQNLSAQVAFANIANNMLMAKDGAGRFYLPARGFNNMAPLGRGNGYQVRMNGAGELVWNVPEQELSGRNSAPIFQSEPISLQKPLETGLNMSLLLSSSVSVAQHTDLGVFSDDGLCVGAASVWGEGPWGIAVWGDDPTTPEVDGALEGESLSIRLIGNSELEKVAVSRTIYATDELKELDVSTFQPSTFDLVNLYPNPFNSKLTIEFKVTGIGNVDLSVTDVAGRTVTDLISGKLDIGSHQVTWDASGLESGIYLFRMEVDGKTTVRKALFVK